MRHGNLKFRAQSIRAALWDGTLIFTALWAVVKLSAVKQLSLKDLNFQKTPRDSWLCES